jgi:hypothetical protein
MSMLERYVSSGLYIPGPGLPSIAILNGFGSLGRELYGLQNKELVSIYTVSGPFRKLKVYVWRSKKKNLAIV